MDWYYSLTRSCKHVDIAIYNKKLGPYKHLRQYSAQVQQYMYIYFLILYLKDQNTDIGSMSVSDCSKANEGTPSCDPISAAYMEIGDQMAHAQ